ncbi:MAG: hypothetical protein JRN20_00355 [Nitrososphaerota archaeon]|nr:hypothetical protein [Nitrososphaerota archaeon]MDG6921697.1 hypothetical protein [Nitrososphaerota archaeon]
MKKVVLFVVAIIAGVIALMATTLWYISIYQAGNSSFEGMMNQMMGNSQSSNFGMQTMPQYVWVLLVMFIVIAVLGVAGLAYYLLYPEIRYTPLSPALLSKEPISSQPPISETVSEVETEKPKETGVQAVSWPVLMKTSKPDEKKVLEVLATHGGKYLQKFIVKEAGLSKLKTHRIVSRFAERGIVTATKSGNTNEIVLADWLQPGSANK